MDPSDTTPAASVSLACCQSLCDLLKELPLPGPTLPTADQCLSARNNQLICEDLSLLDGQLESALIAAKQQLQDLVFVDAVVAPSVVASSPMSPLALQLSLKGLFWTTGVSAANNCWPEANSLETIEPSIRTQLELTENLKLINELQNDCNDADVKYFQHNDCNEDSYSSLGERVKSRQRQHNHSSASQDVVIVPPVVPEDSVVSCVVPPVVVVESTPRQERQERQPKATPKVTPNRSHNSHKSRSNSTTNHSIKDNICHDFQNKDSLVSFEFILNKLMSDCVDDDNDSTDDDDDNRHHKNDMSFDLRIDLKELNALMSLSSKLKHSNRMNDLEGRMSSKLSSFLSLLTNKMTVWFSKFKENEEFLSSDDTSMSSDDNHYWQLLINASKMALNIMTSKGMSSRVVLFEELLEIIINFLSHNLNSKTHVSAAKTSPSKKKSSAVSATTTATKRQVTHWAELLELLREYLTRNQSLNDSIVLMCTRIAMSSLLLNASEMQSSATPIIAHIFAHYAKHRASILEELLQQFPRIPLHPSRHHSDRALNPFTRLLIALTNALYAQGVDARAKITREMLTKQLTECLQVMSGFLSSFTKRCLGGASGGDTDVKAFFADVLSDLLSSLFSPPTITALLLIQIQTKLLITYLAQSAKQTALSTRLNAIEFLAEICSTFARLFAQKDDIRDDATTTLQQLLGRRGDARDDSRRPKNDQTLQMLRLLNEFFGEEKLLAEKLILASLWMKEKPIQDMETQYVALLNSREAPPPDAEAIDATTAELFVKTLELNDFATFSRLFDASLSHVTSSLSLTQNTTQRSRAMKSLSQILVNCSLEKSTQLLARSDLQVAMRSALLDGSTSVREATIDLIGRFVLQSKSLELCDKYCDLIGERILDTGVSVRKRVIKILRDICIQFPEFPKCGEIQLRVIKRVNDEGEGIRKLVLEVVRDLWFRSLNDTTDDAVVSYKVKSLLHVISVMLQTDGSIDALQQLMENIVNAESEVPQSAQTIVDFVVARVLCAPDDTTTTANDRSRALLNLAAIHLVAIFARICPQLLVKHCDSLQSLLSLSCDTVVDIHLRNKVIQSLERILHKVRNPSPQLMTRLEEDLTKQILQSSALILPSSVKCLSVLITTHTQNHKLSADLFHKFKQILVSNCGQNASKPKLLRSVYSLGLFVKHFAKSVDSQSKQLVLDHILALIQSNMANGVQHDNQDVICRCITSLGFIVESDPKICLQRRVHDLYSHLLADGSPEPLCVQVLQNFRNYLNDSLESDERANAAIEWSRESLKTMTSEDSDSSSVQSQIIQQYLAPLLDRALAASVHIRRVACNVIHVIQSGGHVHPLQLVPHLIAMTTDDDRDIRSRADHVLHEIERKFHGFVAMKARPGILLATQLCARLRCRGFRLLDDNSGDVTSRLATLYHVVATNRQSRRGFVQQLLRNFDVNSSQMDAADDTETTDATTETTAATDDTTADDRNVQLVFEMVLFFPFTVCDEILYILQQLECIQSVNSTHTSQLFTELFGFESEEAMDEKFDDNYDTFAAELREAADTIACRQQVLRQIARSLRRLFLVALLRKLLKEFYLIKDEKILEYSPNEAKTWEKPIHRRQIEASNLCETLLRANPSIGADSRIEDLLEEFKRFKSVSLTSNDPHVTNQLIQQKLFVFKKTKTTPNDIQKAFTIDSNKVDDRTTTTTSADDELNEGERKRLLESIRRTSCHVSLIDIGIPESVTNQMSAPPPKRKTSPKRAKRKRIRVEDDSSSDERTSSDDSRDDDDDDRH
ncbi:unnamed protein product [Oppiella nova]|uniref:Nipped-B protein n=1 Tax=Oppiella nova TaxID=334625 RepID=A0A7R9QNV6_9ACAR|nr:unnamed protein product [Oppiella nova]CAG2169560.1 unnamed protein product [Oppiella nova]